MVQEIVVLRAVLLMTVDEAFYEPVKRNRKIQDKELTSAHTKSRVSQTNSDKEPVKHLRIKSAACRRLLALLRAFIPRHPDWITITIHTHTCIH